jgi:two-component system, NarL family, response regulator DevR
MANPPASTIRVLVIDDSELVRRGIISVLTTTTNPRVEVVAEAGTVADAIVESRRVKPDVVLLDVRLPDGTGFEACRAILQNSPESRVVILTAHSNDEMVYEAVTSGAHGYLLKEIDAAALIQAVQDVASGRSILDPDITNRVMRLLRGTTTGDGKPDLSLLSNQERRVLALVAQGRTNKEAGSELGLSENTVKNYLMSVFEKLQVKRRAQAAAIFIQQQSDTQK